MTVRAEVDGAVGRIVIDRPQKLNAFTAAMLKELEAACERLESETAVRVVLVSSSSSKAFCAGADINEWSPLGPQGKWAKWIRAGHRAFERLARLRQPTIALVDGIAYGGGLELALACDLRLASERARFAFPEVGVGTVPAWAGPQRATRLIGAARAKQMVLTAEPIDAGTALAWGLVNELVSSDALEKRAHEIAATISRNAPIAVQAAKQLVDAAGGEALGVAIEAFASGLAAGTDDMKEGTAAFREKRKPRFQGK
jgi:enoyl-CoA hydratase/carnithine racemase